MKQINCNIAGTPTDVPFIHTYGDIDYLGVVSGSRVTFTLNDGDTGGADLVWAGNRVGFIIPLNPGSYEGGPLGLPDLSYNPPAPAVSPLTIVGDHFYRDGKKFLLKGSTDFRLIERGAVGDLDTVKRIVEDRVDCGANYLRLISMKVNNTGWELRPAWDAQREDVICRVFDIILSYGAYASLTFFADTKDLLSDVGQQDAYYAFIQPIMRRYPFLFELVNEDGHPTQNVNPKRFARPTGFLASHGSGLSDVQPVEPFWDYTTYHARRSPEPPNAKPFNNLNPYEFNPEWPHPVPYVCEESVKPQNYGYNPEYAAEMGRAASMGPGAIFHSDAWNDPRVFNEGERPCAIAFYRAVA